MLGLGIGLWRGRPAWTPSDLPPEVLRYWSGRTLRQVASSVGGTGAVDGFTDSSTAAWLADLSTHGRPLVQASAGERPIVGYHPKGRGIALVPRGSRWLASADTIEGARHVYAAVTPVGLDLPSYEPLPPIFKLASQGIVTLGGATDAAHSAVVGLQDTSQVWLPDGSATVDGVAGSTLGGWYRRRVVRVSRASDLATGELRLFRDHDGAMPAQSPVHELIVLSALATAEHHAQVAAWLAWHEATPVVACALDSLTTGYALSTHGSLTHQLAGLFRWCVSFPSLGVPGQQVSTALVNDAARLAAVRGAGRNILVLEGGSNDLYNGALAGTVWSRLRAYRELATAAGFETVICTVPESPFWASVGKTAEVAALNDLIESEWEGAGFVAFVDLGAPSSLDGLHYDAAGVTEAAARVAVAVNGLL